MFALTLVDPQRPYTTAAPVRPDGIGLATQNGRYAISRGDNCAETGIGPDMNVVLWRVEGFTGIGVVAAVADDGTTSDQMCNVRFEQRMSNVPCFTNDAGDCDVAAS